MLQPGLKLLDNAFDLCKDVPSMDWLERALALKPQVHPDECEGKQQGHERHQGQHRLGQIAGRGQHPRL
jgi:hypothetical protein